MASTLIDVVFTGSTANLDAALSKTKQELTAFGGSVEQVSSTTRQLKFSVAEVTKKMQAQGKTVKEIDDRIENLKQQTESVTRVTARFAEEMNLSNSATNNLKVGLASYGSAVTEVTKRQDQARESSRLQITEALKYSALYGGVAAALYKVTEALSSIVKIGTEVQATMAVFTSAFGSLGEATREMKFLVEVSDRYKLSISEVRIQYRKFATAARLSGASLKDVHSIYDNLAKAARGLHLSNDDMAGAFKAVEQMFSKGKVQAEELRGQLGERLPGAFAVMARSMNVTTAELNKMMELGKVTSDVLVGFAEEYAKTITDEGLQSALHTLQADSVALGNSWDAMAQTLFKEVEPALRVFVGGLQVGTEGMKAFTEIGGIEVLKTALLVLTAVLGVKLLHSLVETGRTMVTTKSKMWGLEKATAGATLGTRALTVATNGLKVGMALLGGGVGVIALVVIGLVSYSTEIYEAITGTKGFATEIEKLASTFETLERATFRAIGRSREFTAQSREAIAAKLREQIADTEFARHKLDAAQQAYDGEFFQGSRTKVYKDLKEAKLAYGSKQNALEKLTVATKKYLAVSDDGQRIHDKAMGGEAEALAVMKKRSIARKKALAEEKKLIDARAKGTASELKRMRKRIELSKGNSEALYKEGEAYKYATDKQKAELDALHKSLAATKKSVKATKASGKAKKKKASTVAKLVTAYEREELAIKQKVLVAKGEILESYKLGLAEKGIVGAKAESLIAREKELLAIKATEIANKEGEATKKKLALATTQHNAELTRVANTYKTTETAIKKKVLSAKGDLLGVYELSLAEKGIRGEKAKTLIAYKKQELATKAKIKADALAVKEGKRVEAVNAKAAKAVTDRAKALKTAIANEVKSLKVKTLATKKDALASYKLDLVNKGILGTAQKMLLAKKKEQIAAESLAKVKEKIIATRKAGLTTLQDQINKVEDLSNKLVGQPALVEGLRVEEQALLEVKREEAKALEEQIKQKEAYAEALKTTKEAIAEETLKQIDGLEAYKDAVDLRKYGTEARVEEIQKQEKALALLKQENALYGALASAVTGFLDGSTSSWESFRDVLTKPLEITFKSNLEGFTKNLTDVFSSIGSGSGSLGDIGNVFFEGVGDLFSSPEGTSALSSAFNAGATGGALASAAGANKTGQLGSQVGGAIGFAAGGPIGAAVGSVVGGLLGNFLGGDRPVKATFGGSDSAGDRWYGTKRAVGTKFSYEGDLGSFGVRGGDRDLTSSLGRYDEEQIPAVKAFLTSMEEVDQAVARFLPVSVVTTMKEKLQTFETSSTDLAEVTTDRLKAIFAAMPESLASLVDVNASIEDLVVRLEELEGAYTLVVPAVEVLGWNLGATEVSVLANAVAFSELAGGSDTLSEALGYYYEEVYSTTEQLGQAGTALTTSLDELNSGLGLVDGSAITTTSQLREYIEALDLTTEAGQESAVTALKYTASVVEATNKTDVFAKIVTDLGGEVKVTDGKTVQLAIALEEASGGLDKAETALENYFEKMFTEEETRATTLKEETALLATLNAELGLTGEAIINTSAGLRAFIESLDLTTEAGNRALATALGMVDAIASLEEPEETKKTTAKSSGGRKPPKVKKDKDLLDETIDLQEFWDSVITSLDIKGLDESLDSLTSDVLATYTEELESFNSTITTSTEAGILNEATKQFTDYIKAFVEGAYTEEEILAAKVEQAKIELSLFNETHDSAINSFEGLKKYIAGLDLVGEAGRDSYRQAISLVSGLQAIVAQAEAAADKLAKEQDKADKEKAKADKEQAKLESERAKEAKRLEDERARDAAKAAREKEALEKAAQREAQRIALEEQRAAQALADTIKGLGKTVDSLLGIVEPSTKTTGSFVEGLQALQASLQSGVAYTAESLKELIGFTNTKLNIDDFTTRYEYDKLALEASANIELLRGEDSRVVNLPLVLSQQTDTLAGIEAQFTRIADKGNASDLTLAKLLNLLNRWEFNGVPNTREI